MGSKCCLCDSPSSRAQRTATNRQLRMWGLFIDGGSVADAEPNRQRRDPQQRAS